MIFGTGTCRRKVVITLESVAIRYVQVRKHDIGWGCPERAGCLRSPARVRHGMDGLLPIV